MIPLPSAFPAPERRLNFPFTAAVPASAPAVRRRACHRAALWTMLLTLARALAVPGSAATVALTDNGEPRCCVVVGAESSFQEADLFNWTPRATLLQWAAEDIATYLGRMSGATIPMGPRPVAGLLPIYVGCAPEAVPITRPTEFGDTYVVDSSAQRIVLHGQSRRAVCYAAAHFLHELGVRWYAPGTIGEIVPPRKTIAVVAGRVESAPEFLTRRLWCAGPEQTRWMYRNRLGEPTLPAGHSVHAYSRTLPGYTAGPAGRAEHPEYYARVNGKPGRINLANPEVVRHFATNVLAATRSVPRGNAGGKRGRNALSVSPDDGYLDDERPEVRALNSGEPDPIMGLLSFSDAWFGFLNAVCTDLQRQAPGESFKLGSLAYMNYLQPPTKVRPDPRIIPVIAPIAFNRYVSIGTPGALTSELEEQIIKGWTALSPRVGMYLYNFNLADMAMPYTRRLHWTTYFPKLAALGVRDMTIESHPNWHTMMPGNYVAARLLWDTKTDVTALLDEYYPAYYGPAAAAMRRYDTTLENAYESTRAFAGGVWAMHRILHPEIMSKLEGALSEAEAKVKDQGVLAQRVEIMRYSLNFARLWFAARAALNRFDLAEAERQGAAFVANYQAGYAKYPVFFGPNREWSPNIERYFELFHHRALKDAGRIAREGVVVYQFPDAWNAHLEAVPGGMKPSGKIPEATQARWQPLKTYSASLDEQGLPLFRGVIWYRHEFTLPPGARASRTFKFWCGGVDTKARLWLNGQDLGEHRPGTRPLEVDLSPALQPDRPNTLLLAVDNTFPNEIGTGGMLRPALIYAPKP